MIWMADATGGWTFVNRNWLELRGRTLQEEIGSGWTDGVHPDDRGKCLRDYESAFGARRELKLRYRMRCADGAYRTVNKAGSPWFEDREEPRGYVGSIALDTGEASEAEQLSFLTARERQVLQLVALGFATKEAAAKLGISYKTADSHRTHILKKLRVHQAAGLVRFAVRSGLIEA